MKYEVGKEVESARDGWKEPMPCRYCGGWATRVELSQYGARCEECYRRWCLAAFSEHYVAPKNAKRPTAQEMLDNLRTWEDRHPGERLSGGQRLQMVALERMLAPPTPMVPE